MSREVFASCVEGTENKMFEINDNLVLLPEATNYVRMLGKESIGAEKIYYVVRCFRNETSIGAERLREFTQIGVEYLGDNALDCRKVVRKDAIKLFQKLLCSEEWILEDGVERGLNLYDDSGKTFEITSPKIKKQLLGGGPYFGGAGWALGLERLMLVKNEKN